jgi:hypothetical protein
VLVVVLVATVVGRVALPDNLRGLVPVLAPVAAVMLTLAIALPRWAEKVWPVLLTAFVTVGVAFVRFSGETRPYGVIAILLAIAVFPMLLVTIWSYLKAWEREETRPPLPRLRTVATSLLVGVTVATTVLGFIGIQARGEGTYALRYGRPVPVVLGEECIIHDNDSEDSSAVKTATCRDAQWMIDGRMYRGRVLVTVDELDVEFDPRVTSLFAFRNRSVTAYTVPGDSRAFTPAYAANGTEGLHVFSVVPWWFTLAIPLLIVALILRAVIRAMIRRARSATTT